MPTKKPSLPAGRQAHKVLLEKWAAENLKLKRDLAKKHGSSLKWLSQNSKNLALGSLGALLMLASSGPQASSIRHVTFAQEEAKKNIDQKAFLISDLSNVLPKQVRPLDQTEESQISQILSRSFGLDVKPTLEGKRLNTTYGIIGKEQHLARFPGDSIDTHFDNTTDSAKFSSEGMAPGLSAWGYFAKSQTQMTTKDSDREKYYIAVQTFLSQDFSERFAQYRDFYKYRKMLVVNPTNGRAIVADIADAGPAPWTGKQLGGSAEVMSYLERVDGAGRGAVLYFFIDDPNNKVPLGPIDIVK